MVSPHERKFLDVLWILRRNPFYERSLHRYGLVVKGSKHHKFYDPRASDFIEWGLENDYIIAQLALPNTGTADRFEVTLNGKKAIKDHWQRVFRFR